jgi:hypothetical protein
MTGNGAGHSISSFPAGDRAIINSWYLCGVNLVSGFLHALPGNTLLLKVGPPGSKSSVLTRNAAVDLRVKLNTRHQLEARSETVVNHDHTPPRDVGKGAAPTALSTLLPMECLTPGYSPHSKAIRSGSAAWTARWCFMTFMGISNGVKGRCRKQRFSPPPQEKSSREQLEL